MILLVAHKVFNTAEGEPAISLPTVVGLVILAFCLGLIRHKNKKDGTNY